ncbi:MAG: hypothetical protein IPO48_11930 [Saprospiraceae bacterium]|nr:hypothetical protein [Saprospiraceae bacterium]
MKTQNRSVLSKLYFSYYQSMLDNKPKSFHITATLTKQLSSFFYHLKRPTVPFLPSTGTTSVCPERINPPSTAGPILQNKDFFVLFSVGYKMIIHFVRIEYASNVLYNFQID